MGKSLEVELLYKRGTLVIHPGISQSAGLRVRTQLCYNQQLRECQSLYILLNKVIKLLAFSKFGGLETVTVLF